MTNQINITYKRLQLPWLSHPFLSVVMWLNLKETNQHNLFRVVCQHDLNPRQGTTAETPLTGGTGSTATGALVQGCPTAHWNENMGHWKI